MNLSNATTGAPWQAPEPVDIKSGAGRTAQDIEKREELLPRVIEVGNRNRWSKAEVARNVGMSDGTFGQWFKGNYAGRLDVQNEKISKWLDTIEELQDMTSAIPASPSFIETKLATEMMNTLGAAQVLPAMVLITAHAGFGKTMTARQFQRTRSNVYLVTASPHSRSAHGILLEIAETLGVGQGYTGKVARAIGRKLQRTGVGTLLIVDEANELTDEAINQLRHFLDMYQCGVALVGNTETYRRFSSWTDGLAGGQLRRRVFKRINRTSVPVEDLRAFIRASGIDDPDQTKFLIGVGQKEGAIGQIDMTIRLARVSAIGDGRELALDDLKSAWTNRNVDTRAG
ncbi:MAG: AAA family ATPase [Nitratireductor sp.]|nr:AAA family ATPase [Nitratireductor sp.]